MTQKISQVSKLYPKLYHYTNQKGLEGILKSQSLWATHYKNLNDGTELKIFDNTIKKPLSEKFEKVFREAQNLHNRKVKKSWEKLNKLDLQKEVEKEAKYLLGVMRKAIGENFFINSFCYHDEGSYEQKNGLLSQWRSYGKEGYAIIFDTKKLWEMLSLEEEKFPKDRTFIMSNVIYEGFTEDDREDFDDDLEKILTHSTEFVKTKVRGKIDAARSSIGETYEPFVKCLSRLKHIAFKEEKEIRLVCHSSGKESSDANEANCKKLGRETKSRSRNGESILYQEIFGFPDKKLPIERIIIGPGKNQNDLEKGLLPFLKKENLKKIDITKSETPLII